ncbi:hypothetical protein SAMN05421810_10174 [Amycolatopsis arida]|uniref:Uncharacterized protein n=1 Tax=Amycolatopsis arida TaxID=587909 RepID=A0A1I5KB56_9PSEU|nr:hypothetical protein [Amycolatopsis arida]TDX96970.1 hypothetical protein CLV69_10272 [Amycolatopsis arida]SFO82294.1 hypothetical protein SAMN05421810_10174 [Amycolatopsis arida]
MRLVERLPDHSHYKVAIHDDDELARRQQDAERAGAKRPGRTRAVDAHTWTPERAALTDIGDILLGIRASLEAQRTGRRQRVTPLPRPRLARDRLEAADSYRRHRDRVRLMLGRG